MQDAVLVRVMHAATDLDHCADDPPRAVLGAEGIRPFVERAAVDPGHDEDRRPSTHSAPKSATTDGWSSAPTAASSR